MDAGKGAEFAAAWERDWNAHDLEALLAHFAEDVVWTSPVAAHIVAGSDGVVRGRSQLRDYYETGLRLTPDLHFEVLDVYVGVSTLVINYRNQRGSLVNEVLIFDGSGMVREGHGTYSERGPGGAKTATG